MLIRLLLLMSVLVSVDVAAASKKHWERLPQCSYVAMEYNDGDSFRVRCGEREFVLRLYYIDTPETNLSDGTRVSEQRAHFGVTIEHILAGGENAAVRVRELLQKPFVVTTRWAGAGGRSAEPRYASLVEFGGQSLIERLLIEGLARTKGVAVNLPTGEKSSVYLERLRDLERQAKEARRGIWAQSKG